MSVGGVIWMFASTNVFSAGPLFGATPFVVSVTEPPATVTVAVAVPVTRPGVAEVNTIVHWPFASVFGPALSHVLAAAFSAAFAPFELVSVKSTCAPGIPTKPAPLSCSTRR